MASRGSENLRVCKRPGGIRRRVAGSSLVRKVAWVCVRQLFHQVLVLLWALLVTLLATLRRLFRRYVCVLHRAVSMETEKSGHGADYSHIEGKLTASVCFLSGEVLALSLDQWLCVCVHTGEWEREIGGGQGMNKLTLHQQDTWWLYDNGTLLTLTMTLKGTHISSRLHFFL